MSSPFPKSMTIKQAVISTLAYFDLFGVPLTREEMLEHLFFLEPDENKIGIYLRESPLIVSHDGYLSLQGDTDFYARFKEQKQRAKQYWRKVKRWRWIFSICPYVKWVAVCNSLPLAAVEEGSDIDLFVVAEKGRLFTARFMLTFLTALFGVRRHGSRVAGRFCLSFYISEEASDLSAIAQKPYDIYLAYWVKTLQPIAGDYQGYRSFMAANRDWLKPYFHEMLPHKRRFRSRTFFQMRVKGWLEALLGFVWVESKLSAWQLKRATEKSTTLADGAGTIITPTMLKFHDEDARESVRQAWLERVETLV